MEAQASHEMDRLRAIESKAQAVQQVLETRLPPQLRHLAALVCGFKWRLQTAGDEVDARTIVKKVRMELGAFDYRAKEQAELLTRYLCELDDILSFDNSAVKAARKALVVSIQELLTRADAFKERSAKLKQFGEDLVSPFEPAASAPATPSDNGAESDDMHVKALFDEGDSVSAGEEESSESEEEEGEGEVAGAEQDTDAQAAADQGMEPAVEEEKGDEDMADDEEDDEEDDDEEEAIPPQKTQKTSQSPSTSSRVTDRGMNIDVNSLPVWRPYYQLQRRQDGVYMVARLRDTDPRHVRVQWSDRTGLLRVSGFKMPTQKDVVASRLTDAPTFGRFEIAEQFQPDMLNMEEATQQMFEDGTLQIRMPYYMPRYPQRFGRSSLFQPRDCFVW